MGRGKQTCFNTENHQMSPFTIVRRDKKKRTNTITSGVRCKWCKLQEGKVIKVIEKD